MQVVIRLSLATRYRSGSLLTTAGESHPVPSPDNVQPAIQSIPTPVLTRSTTSEAPDILGPIPCLLERMSTASHTEA